MMTPRNICLVAAFIFFAIGALSREMKLDFYFNYGTMVKPERGFFVNTDKLLRDSAADVADALTKEAERIGSEGNESDVKFADKLESLACKLDDAFKE